MKRLARAAEVWIWCEVGLKVMGVALVLLVFGMLYQVLLKAGVILGL